MGGGGGKKKKEYLWFDLPQGCISQVVWALLGAAAFITVVTVTAVFLSSKYIWNSLFLLNATFCFLLFAAPSAYAAALLCTFP